MSANSSSDQKQWLKRQERLSASAVRGRYFPSVEDLKFGMPFFMDDMAFDAKTFAERYLLRLSHDDQDAVGANVIVALKCLTVDQGVKEYLSAASAFRNWAHQKSVSRALSDPEVRCTFYAASEGDKESIMRVCGIIGHAIRRRSSDVDETKAAIDLLLGVSMSFSDARNWESDMVQTLDFARARKLGAAFTQRLLSSHLRDGNTEEGRSADEKGKQSLKEASKPDGSDSDNSLAPSLLVFPKIGNESHPDGDKVTKVFADVMGKKLPLVLKPCLNGIRRTLCQEFPYAGAVIDLVLKDLMQNDHVAFRPIILAGLPGCGKTRFACRFADLLGVPHEVYNCAGINDSSFGGTARRWSSSESAMPVWMIANSKIANPMLILDEIEKADPGKNNGSLLDSLLPMLERSSAKRFFDIFLQASVDLSAVLWIGTSNDPSLLPQPLRDRCRILPFPSPTAEHLPSLAKGILGDIVNERQLDSRWIGRLTGDEIEALSAVWPGGSLRALRKYIEGVLTARDAALGVN